MADREERKIQASKHEALMKGAFAAETQAAVAATIVYEEGEGRELSIPEPAFESTETVVTKAFVPEAAYRYATGKTLIVDPAAFTRPGGAYEDGAFGPEQVICSESNLYQILCGLKEITDAACCAPIVRRTSPKWCSSMAEPCARPMSWPFPSRCAFAPSKTTAPSASAIRLLRRASRPFCALPWQTNAKRSCAARLPAEIWDTHRRR